MARWIVTLFAVGGAFVVGGIGGAIVFDWLGLWDLCGAGFGAAFGVVTIAYFTAPDPKLPFALVCFVLGAMFAWRLVGHETYPESYGPGKAYQPTLLPFAITLAGGLAGLVVVCACEIQRARARRHGADVVDAFE